MSLRLKAHHLWSAFGSPDTFGGRLTHGVAVRRGKSQMNLVAAGRTRSFHSASVSDMEDWKIWVTVIGLVSGGFGYGVYLPRRIRTFGGISIAGSRSGFGFSVHCLYRRQKLQEDGQP